MSDLDLGLPTPRHPPLPCPLPGPSLEPPGPPSPHLTRYLPWTPGWQATGEAVSRPSGCKALPDPASSPHGGKAAASSLRVVPYPQGQAQAAGRWLRDEPALAWPGASSALHRAWLPGSASSHLSGPQSPHLLRCKQITRWRGRARQPHPAGAAPQSQEPRKWRTWGFHLAGEGPAGTLHSGNCKPSSSGASPCSLSE